MIIAGAKCDDCGRIDHFPYTTETAVKVLLRQSGWHFIDDKCICPICIIKQNNNKSNEMQ